MTVAVPGGADVMPYDGDYGNLGLEDVLPSDLSLPRLNIKGPEATFEHSVTKVQYSGLNAIFLAQIKQRVMWHPDVDENYKQPQCRSTTFDVGFPNVDPRAPAGRSFPWQDGNFDPAAGQAGAYLPDITTEVGLPALPCDKCKFKDWEDKKTRCKEQHVYPLLFQEQDLSWSPAILTIQGSGIKPSKQYVQTFATRKLPLFSAITLLTLTPASRGTVKYAIPVFKKVGDTDRAEWDEWAVQTRSTREFLRAYPRPRDEGAVTQVAPSVPTPAATASNVNGPAAAVPPVPIAGTDPWTGEPVQAPVAPPVQAAVPPPAAPAPAPPVTPPPAAPVPVAAQPAPPVAPPPPAPPVAPPPPAPPVVAAAPAPPVPPVPPVPTPVAPVAPVPPPVQAAPVQAAPVPQAPVQAPAAAVVTAPPATAGDTDLPF